MRFNLIRFVIIGALFCACEKRKYPEEKVQLEAEDIFCEATFGGEPINLKIGTDDYYCYSSYRQNADSIYIFEGELRKFDCNPCPSSLKIELFDCRKRAPGSIVAVDSSFRTGRRNFVPPNTNLNILTFTSNSNKVSASVRWNTTTGQSGNSSVFNYECMQPGSQSVSLTVRTTDNCESTVTNSFVIGENNYLFACSFMAQGAQNTNAVFASTVIGGSPPFQYKWYFGDGSTSNEIKPAHNYLYSGSYPVKLVVTDAANKICESNYIHIAGNDPSSCAANITLAHKGSSSVFLEKIRLQWIDRSSTVFRSDIITQPAESYFEIMNSEAYESNEKGEAGRLLTVKYNVLLSDGSKSMWFKSEKTSIAVTYK